MCQSKQKARNRSPGLKSIIKLRKEVNRHNLVKNETNNKNVIISHYE